MWREFCKFHLGHFHEDIKEESMRKPRSSLSWSKMENIKFIQGVNIFRNYHSSLDCT
ncbi:hypothetical protein ACS0TY_015412 [Phlomoides rotata]